MDETLVLLCLVVVMLIGSYLAGNIPLVVSLSEEKLKVVSVFGAGLLVGTALTVIIPEGIRALYDDKTIAPVSPGNHVDSSPKDPILDEAHSSEHSSTIGLSLVLGFIFMMLVDQISTRRDGASAERNMTATIGLIVHAAADGVALGAAAHASHHDVEMVVFLAIMLHKAPAAFGLVSFLLHEGFDRHRIRKHLAMFSMSAPLLTLLTYFGIGQEQKETLNSFNATGIAMLFSAGTFLYVATVHVLPELTQGHTSSGASSGPHYTHLEQGTPQPKGYSGLRNAELAILICGALLPLLLTMGHHH
ncbi:zinc transporter ZIP9 [Lutzomyia longipalpis]|uniref:Putative zinc transporter zip9 n=1 Tax=Lutzomyia longipalpis TaxID=7200 RepID=A0A7G3B7E3_LUTLO|nr:zinc transporter ZIP9 [Lutzomyia longipalpis]XP_055693963.1 zinc transporter ZIP9 [Lutzomyia longipalpis]